MENEKGVMKVLCSVCLLVSVFFTFSCRPPNDYDEIIDPPIHHIKIAGAKMLILSSSGIQPALRSSAGARAIDDNPVIYKLTEEGQLIEVRMYDEDGNKVENDIYRPIILEDLTQDYLYIEFERHHDLPWNRFFIRKKNGYVFEAPIPTAIGGCAGFLAERTTGTIDDGNIYYIPWEDQPGKRGALHRINTSDPKLLTDVRVSPASDRLHLWGPTPLVTSSGEILYFGSAAGEIVRIIRPNGSVEEIFDILDESIKESFPTAFPTFLGTDSNIYYLHSENCYLSDIGYWIETYVLKLVIEDNDVSLQLYGTLSTRDGEEKICHENPFHYIYPHRKIKYLHIGNKIIAVAMTPSPPIWLPEQAAFASVAEVYNSTTEIYQPEEVSLLFEEIYDAQTSDNYYFLLGKSVSGSIVLNRVNAATHAPSPLTVSADYEIYQIKAISDTEVIFRALRYSDGADIIGSVDQSSEVTIISEVVGHPEIELVRVR